jgi:hypothetical protein
VPRLANPQILPELKFVLQLFWVPRIYTVLRYVEKNDVFCQKSILIICFIFNRNLIQRQAMLSLVVVSDLVKHWTNILNAMLSIIYAAMKTCATITQLVSVLNHINIIKKRKH